MNKMLVATLAAVTALFVLRASAQEQQASAPGHQTASQVDAGKAQPASDRDAHAAGDGAPHATAGASHDGAGAHDEGPVPPADKSPVWAGVVLILILAMFVMAAVIGPVARAHAPPAEIPPTHSHDEPPGASHHHGASGTINPEPGHGHSSGHHH